MKQIARRLYTKPVMLGMSFLMGVALVVGLFVTTRSGAAAVTGIPEGDDLFETTGNGETYHNFQASPIPADFFGPASEEFKGVVPLVGVPIPGRGDDVDTVIHRNGCLSTPCTVAIQMTALNLKSINSITVTYSDDTPDETWSVEVGLSDVKTSTGTMTFSADGTSFDSTLKVYPKFTFTRGDTVKVLDTGSSGPGLTAAATIAEPCIATVEDFEGTRSDAAATSSCPPVTLTSTNSPWPITRPITEQELLASHNASPPGTKRKALAAKAIAIGE